ncbi:MAG TPA: hypothetical protein VIK18_11360, partial [Pirellulales bacterium]
RPGGLLLVLLLTAYAMAISSTLCGAVLVEVFGERGRHARSAVGMSSLPDGIPVEIEIIVAVR